MNQTKLNELITKRKDTLERYKPYSQAPSNEVTEFIQDLQLLKDSEWNWWDKEWIDDILEYIYAHWKSDLWGELQMIRQAILQNLPKAREEEKEDKVIEWWFANDWQYIKINHYCTSCGYHITNRMWCQNPKCPWKYVLC